MRDQIKALVEHAGFYVTEKNGQALEELIVLVVRECISQVEKTYVGSIHSHAGPWNAAVEKCTKHISTHFGIDTTHST